ncbi:hypothetical protein BV375_09655 [Nostoc sp. 106C]|nr:hypothetical protein BV375_09655 [Nostoc sp. 106C]
MKITVYQRQIAQNKLSYDLNDVTNQCIFTYFSPYNSVGSRLNSVVNIASNGLITPTDLGITFIHISVNSLYIVARIQVHDRLEGWWFGTPGLTVPKDDQIPHTQVTIYAQFSDDPPIAAVGGKCDRVGDITGHGYVDLTSSDPSTLLIDNSKDYRLRGVKEGDVSLTGSFRGGSQTIPAKVVDYGKQRNLERVRYKGNATEKHNILFLPEGFTNADKSKFDEIVTEATNKLFDAKRHSPYNLLKESFNVWKIFEPSQQQAVTCGFKVNDEDISFNSQSVLQKGFPIPYNGELPGEQPSTNYTVEVLVEVVGLPLRGESRSPAALRTLWASQLLPDPFAPDDLTKNLDPSKATDKVIEVWKKQTSLGILEERNTFFGLYLGSRYADTERLSVRGDGTFTPPSADNVSNQSLHELIRRIYGWFKAEPSRNLTPDPRKHPPELHQYNQKNLGNSILKYIGALRDANAVAASVGQEWLPDSTGNRFIKSRGLIAIITNDGMIGGTNFNQRTMTANSVDQGTALAFQPQFTPTKKIMQRMPNPGKNLSNIIDTIAHEFGHSFNLADEYEDFVGDQPDTYSDYDNATTLSQINLDSNYKDKLNRRIDIAKIKWFDLLRVQTSSILIRDAKVSGNTITVYIEKNKLGGWRVAKELNFKAALRDMTPSSSGIQLPLQKDNAHYLLDLDIIEPINGVDETTGIVTLISRNQTPQQNTFKKGTLVFVPFKDASGNYKSIVEKEVRQQLSITHLPLNEDTNVSIVNKDVDYPVSIPDFKPPCKSYRLLGIYEGAQTFTGKVYRAAGQCKMRSSGESSAREGEFCFLCKYLIVNRVNANLLDLLDEEYPENKTFRSPPGNPV